MLPQSMFPVVRDPECACPPRIVSYVGGTESDGDILIYDATTDTWGPAAPNPGDITAVNVTAPITGGGASGAVTIGVDTMVGDSGAGGARGVVPAPAIGDATKFLRGDGTWAAAGGSGGVSVLANLQNNSTVIITSATPVLVTGMTATVATTAGKSQEVVFEGYAYLEAYGSALYSSLIYYWLYVDGSPVAGKHEDNHINTSWQEHGIHLSCLVTGLAAGNHTFEIRAHGNSYVPPVDLFINVNGTADLATRMYIKEF